MSRACLHSHHFRRFLSTFSRAFPTCPSSVHYVSTVHLQSDAELAQRDCTAAGEHSVALRWAVRLLDANSVLIYKLKVHSHAVVEWCWCVTFNA